MTTVNNRDDEFKALFPMRHRAGLSYGDGLLVEGDPKSIDRVRKALHDAEVMLPAVRERLDETTKAAAVLRNSFDENLSRLVACHQTIIGDVRSALGCDALSDVVLYAQIIKKNHDKRGDEIGELRQKVQEHQDVIDYVRRHLGAAFAETTTAVVDTFLKGVDSQIKSLKLRAKLFENQSERLAEAKKLDQVAIHECLKAQTISARAEIVNLKKQIDEMHQLAYSVTGHADTVEQEDVITYRVNGMFFEIDEKGLEINGEPAMVMSVEEMEEIDDRLDALANIKDIVLR
jgi:hypothetical protein